MMSIYKVTHIIWGFIMNTKCLLRNKDEEHLRLFSVNQSLILLTAVDISVEKLLSLVIVKGFLLSLELIENELSSFIPFKWGYSKIVNWSDILLMKNENKLNFQKTLESEIKRDEKLIEKNHQCCWHYLIFTWVPTTELPQKES